METILQDIKYSFRMLAKNIGFTIVAVLALALGTGANTAIFSIVNGVLLHPLPYGEPDKVMMVWVNNLKTGKNQQPISVPDFEDYRKQSQAFDQLAAFSYQDFNLIGEGEPEHLTGSIVTANFFSTLGVTPIHGRVFLPEEDQPGANRVVILSHGLWQRRFASDPDIVGKSILLNDAPFVIVGITPANFRAPEKKDEIWVPLSMDGGDAIRVPSVVAPDTINKRSSRFLLGIGRLKPGFSREQAQKEMETIAGRLEEQYKDTNTSVSLQVVPIEQHLIGDIRPALLILLAAVGFVLLIACANVANLLLARATARQKEFSIRTALGATRFRLIRQLMTESLILGLIGGILGLLIAFSGIRLLKAINPANIPRLDEIGIDIKVLGFTILISILTGIIFGLIPAIQASSPDLNETLKEGARGSTGGIRRNRLRSIFVIIEVSLATVLLIGAGLMIKSFLSLQNVDPGFNPNDVLTMRITLPQSKYSEDQQVRDFFGQVLDRVKALPGVQSAGAAIMLPLSEDKATLRFTIDGRPPATPNERLLANYRSISPDYFRAIGISLKSGRVFTDQDNERSPGVVILNETMAKTYWPEGDALGKHLTIPSSGNNSREIVGIVGDVKHSGLDTESGTEMYVPYLQTPWPFMSLVVRTSSPPTSLARSVRDQVYAVDSNQPVYEIKTMQEMVSDSISQPRLYTVLLGTFSAVALLLAAIGIYGVMSYSVNQRKHEIGIRMALGATRGNILKLIVGQGMILALIGLGLGVGAAVVLTRLMESLLFGVSARDLMIFISIPVLLAFVAFLACYVPARRATKVDPMVALRYE